MAACNAQRVVCHAQKRRVQNASGRAVRPPPLPRVFAPPATPVAFTFAPSLPTASYVRERTQVYDPPALILPSSIDWVQGAPTVAPQRRDPEWSKYYNWPNVPLHPEFEVSRSTSPFEWSYEVTQ